MSDNLRSIYEQATEDAKDFGVRRNFGKMLLNHQFKKWENKMAVEITKSEYDTTPANQRFLEVEMSIDLAEFNPDLFVQVRRVSIPSAHWKKHVEKSLYKTLGKKSVLGDVHERYVEVMDVPTDKEYKDGFLHMYEFVRVFESRDKCWNAYQEVYGGRQDSASAPASVSAAPIVGEFPPNFQSFAAWQPVAVAIKNQNPQPNEYARTGELYGVSVDWVVKALTM